MAVFKREVASAPVGSYPCFTGYTTCQKIVLCPNNTKSILVGYKTFHCFRRFSYGRLPECAKCEKDYSAECFRLVKPFLGRLDYRLLVDVYRRKAKAELDNGVIWWDNPYFEKIYGSMRVAENIAPIKDITEAKQVGFDEDVPF